MPKINKKSKIYKQPNQYRFQDEAGNEIDTIPNGQNDPAQPRTSLALVGSNSSVNATGFILHTHPDSNSYTDDNGNKIYICHICITQALEGRTTGKRNFRTRAEYLRHIYAHVPTCKCKLTFKKWSDYDDHIPHCTALTLANRVNRQTRPYRRIPYDNTKRAVRWHKCKHCQETFGSYVVGLPMELIIRSQKNHARWCEARKRSRLFKKTL